MEQIEARPAPDGLGEMLPRRVASDALGVESQFPRQALQKTMRLHARDGPALTHPRFENGTLGHSPKASQQVRHGAPDALRERYPARPNSLPPFAGSTLQMGTFDRDFAGYLACRGEHPGPVERKLLGSPQAAS